MAAAQKPAAVAQDIANRRLDPYSGRNFTEEPILKRVLDEEVKVENVIRERTWRIIKDRCVGHTAMSKDWELAFERWRSQKS